MRPLDKYKVDTPVILDDGTEVVVSEIYDPYGNARPILLNNFGDYCSYCENSLHNGTLFDTEHIRPKDSNPDLKTKWSNFLIGCRACNGPSGKWKNDIKVPTMHLPHLNNTFLSLIYDEAGGVSVNTSLSKESQKNAQALIDFVHLDKSPKKSLEDKDGRCKMRRMTWKMAKDMLNLYENNRCETTLKMLLKLIEQRGGWSIWFTVFKNHDEVRKAMIDFHGTAKDCFDANNHYEPIPRNPLNEIDPI